VVNFNGRGVARNLLRVGRSEIYISSKSLNGTLPNPAFLLDDGAIMHPGARKEEKSSAHPPGACWATSAALSVALPGTAGALGDKIAEALEGVITAEPRTPYYINSVDGNAARILGTSSSRLQGRRLRTIVAGCADEGGLIRKIEWAAGLVGRETSKLSSVTVSAGSEAWPQSSERPVLEWETPDGYCVTVELALLSELKQLESAAPNTDLRLQVKLVHRPRLDDSPHEPPRLLVNPVSASPSSDLDKRLDLLCLSKSPCDGALWDTLAPKPGPGAGSCQGRSRRLEQGPW
jgi:hypothetical protein